MNLVIISQNIIKKSRKIIFKGYCVILSIYIVHIILLVSTISSDIDKCRTLY